MKPFQIFLRKYKSDILLILFIFFVVLFLYGRYVFLYFSQDDFFHLRVTQTDGSFFSFIKLLGFRPYSESGIYFYRPLFRELLFNLYYKFFGANPLPFRLTHFLIHGFNIILVYFLAFRLFKNKTQAFFSALFFGIIAANIGVLAYLAGGITVSGMLFCALISILFQIRNNEVPKLEYKLLSFIFFVLALVSHETASVLPLIFLAFKIRKNGLSIQTITSSLKDLFLFFVPVAIIFFAEIFIIGLPVSEAGYDLNFSLLRLANSYFWYSMWGIGIPEMLVDFIGPGVKINPNLMKYWGNYFLVIFILMFIVILLLIFTSKKLIKNKDFLFFAFWFLIGLTPVVFLPFHKQYYYLEIVLPAISAIISIVFIKLKENFRILSYIYLGSLILLNIVSIKLGGVTYWSIQRSIQAKKIINELVKKYPNLPKGSIVYFTNSKSDPYFNEDWGHSSKQASVILSGSDAVQVLYKDPTLKVYYEDLEKPPSGKPVFAFEVDINP